MSYAIRVEGDDITPVEYPTWLSAMEKENIFSVTLRDGEFHVEEECDGWYHVVLTAEQVRALGYELVALSGL